MKKKTQKDTLETDILSDEQVRQEHANLTKAMDAIRFLIFKHAVQYWKDASGTDDEKAHSIFTLARSANWKHDGNNQTETIVKSHTK